MSLSPTAAAHLADAILVLHVGIAVFVVVMSVAVLLGGVRRWRWIRRRGPRVLHAGLVAVIALQAWLGRLCPLTTWEQRLRAQLRRGIGVFVRVVLRDHPAVGQIDLGIAGLRRQSKDAIRRVAPANAEPVRVEGMADQHTDRQPEQRIATQQEGAGKGAQQFSVPALHAASLPAGKP